MANEGRRGSLKDVVPGVGDAKVLSVAVENTATRVESDVEPWTDPIIGIVKHFVELLPSEQSEKMLAFLTGTFQELSDDRKERYKQDVVELPTAGASEEEVAEMILKMTGGYDPDLSGGGSCNTTIPNDTSVDEKDDKAESATFAAPAPVNVTINCN